MLNFNKQFENQTVQINKLKLFNAESELKMNDLEVSNKGILFKISDFD